MGELKVHGSSHPPVCRGCGHKDLHLVLDLGSTPLANSLLCEADLAAPEDRFPLVLYFCPKCTLVQIGETVIPERLFKHYLYASSFSDTMLAHARELVELMMKTRKLTKDSLVIEIASNDGYLLQYYKQHSIPVLGIEPAENIAAVAEKEHGIPTLVEFFGPALAARLVAEGRKANVIHANNVFAHVPSPSDFVAALKQLLKPDGVVVIEAPYVGELIRNLEFDTIYHEHFSYFSLTAVEIIARRHGMQVADVDLVKIHGGSLRLFITHAGAAPVTAKVIDMLARERAMGMHEAAYYDDFSGKIWRLKAELVGHLQSLKKAGHSIAAYGASAKGSTLLNAFGIGREILDFVADRSTLKQGLYTPGNHIPIVPPAALAERAPDYALLLTWNFADEVLAQQKAYRDAGGHFIVPLPTVRIV
jgi:SAM-dependent methyltransferase